MNNTHTSIALILDRSGSMEQNISATIESTNAFLSEQRKAEGTADLTLTLFDDQIETPHLATNIQDVPYLNNETYTTRGCTALLDAIGITIDTLGKRLSDLPESDRPSSVIVAILTDGEENSSKKFDWKQINQKIRHQEKQYNWEFMFLGAGADSIAQASRMGINQDNISSYETSAQGYHSAADAYSKKVAYRRASKSRDLTLEEQCALDKPLQQIVEENMRGGKS